MAGISILRRLLMKQAMKENAPFQHEGIMSISRSLSGNVDAKVKRMVESAKRQGVDFDKYTEQEIKYILELNKPKPPKVYSNEEAYEILNRFANKNKRGEVIKADFGKPFAEEVVTVESVITDIKKLDPIESMKEANKVLRGEGRYKSLSKADREKIVGDKSVTDHIFERNVDVDIDPDEPEFMAQGGRTGLSYLLAEDSNQRVPFNIGGIPFKKDGFFVSPDFSKMTPEEIELYKIQMERMRKGFERKMSPEDLEKLKIQQQIREQQRKDMGLPEGIQLMNQGGRVPFKLGGIDKMRRAFLKAIGAGAATAGAAKTGLFGLLKGGSKQAAKDLTQVPIGNPPGMPPWFKPLVNRVIREGEDVTKKFATKEREIVHQISVEGKIGKDAIGVDDIRVTQDLDTGNVRVQYNTTKSPGESGVDLNYKASEEIPLKGEKSSVKTTEEFSAVEAEPRYTGGPEDADIEWDGENIVSEVKDLMSDTSALKKFATNKPLSKKELAIAKQKQNKLKSLNESNVEQANFIEEKYGPGPDPSDLVDYYYGKADGGLANMLGE